MQHCDNVSGMYESNRLQSTPRQSVHPGKHLDCQEIQLLCSRSSAFGTGLLVSLVPEHIISWFVSLCIFGLTGSLLDC